MIDRIRDGRTDLVFGHVKAGGAATARAGTASLIQWCAYYGDVSAIRFLLANGEELASLGGNLGLEGAAFHGHWRLCEYLVEAGADANHRRADNGEAVLHAALSNAGRASQKLVVDVLLAAGADPNVATIAGAETGAFMRDARTRGETPLHRAAAYADEPVVRALLDAGARREAKDAHGDTPLGWASWHLRPAAILRLLCHGDHAIHNDAAWTGDHGRGLSGMDAALLGRPRGAGEED